jgi:hypothetical protein
MIARKTWFIEKKNKMINSQNNKEEGEDSSL